MAYTAEQLAAMSPERRAAFQTNVDRGLITPTGTSVAPPPVTTTPSNQTSGNQFSQADMIKIATGQTNPLSPPPPPPPPTYTFPVNWYSWTQAQRDQWRANHPGAGPNPNPPPSGGGGGTTDPPPAGGGGGGTQADTTSMTLLNPQQKEIVALAMPDIRQFANASNADLRIQGNPTVGFTPQQLEAQKQAIAAAGGSMTDIAKWSAETLDQLLAGGPVNPADPTLKWLMENSMNMGLNPASRGSDWLMDAATRDDPTKAATEFFMNPDILRADANPYLTSYMDAAVRPLYQQLMETALPGIRSGAAGAGQYGSSRQGIAEGLGIGRTSQAAGDTTAKIASEGYGQGLEAMLAGTRLAGDAEARRIGAVGQGATLAGENYGRGLESANRAAATSTEAWQSSLDAMTKALGLAPSTQAMALAPSQVMAGVGDATQAQLQKEKDAQTYQQIYNAMVPLSKAQSLMGLASGTPGGGTGVTDNAETGLLEAILGGAATGGSIGGTFGQGGIGSLAGGGLGALLSLFD